MEDLDLPRGIKIYINQSLCPYYQILWSKAKRLQNIGSIDSFYISSGTIKIKVTENSSPMTIMHLDDFKLHFSDIDLSPPTDASKFRVHNMFMVDMIFLVLCFKAMHLIYLYFFCLFTDTCML